MKKYSIALFIFFYGFQKGTCQQVSYELPVPQGWDSEKISFPIDFARSIPYTGTEEIRFMPGWANSKSDEYWSYVFVWLLQGKPDLHKENLKNYLSQYYNGLYVSSQTSKLVSDSPVTKVSVRSAHRQRNDKKTFHVVVNTLNYATHSLLILHGIIHVRKLGIADHFAIWFEMSPQSFHHHVWTKLDAVTESLILNSTLIGRNKYSDFK